MGPNSPNDPNSTILSTTMASGAGSTRLISKEHAFDPAIDSIALYNNWGKAKTRARKRLSGLERYAEVPDLDFLHDVDDLIAFVKLQSSEAGFWSYNHPDEEMNAAGDFVRSAAQRLLVEITSSPGIAKHLETVVAEGLDGESQRFLEFAKREARRSGAYLNEKDQAAFKANNIELEGLKQEFIMIEEEPYLWVQPELLDCMPSDFRETHKPNPSTGQVKVSVNASDYVTFVEYCEDDETVEKLYKLRESMAPKNEQVLKSILELRGQQAKLLGYPSYADYALEFGMISSPQTVRGLLVGANDKARVQSEREKRVLSALLTAENRRLEEWNVPYANQQLLRSPFPDFDPLAARTYFPLSSVVSGAMTLLGKFLGLEFREVHNVSTWHSSVRTFDVYDTAPTNALHREASDTTPNLQVIQDPIHKPRLRGRLYLDLLSREHKAPGPCAIDLRSSALGSPVLPEICLSASYGHTTIACIGFEGCAHLLHELGHCVHFLMAQQSPYYRFNGFSHELYFLEVPSMLLEELLQVPEVVQTMAVDTSGDVIPLEYQRTLIAGRNMNKAMNVRTQSLYSLISVCRP